MTNIIKEYKQKISEILNCDFKEIRFFTNKIELTNDDLLVHSKMIKKDEYENNDHYLCSVYKNKELITSFKLYEFPKCCAILVSCNAVVTNNFVNLKIGTITNILRQDIARLLGYSCLMCTDVEQNKFQRQLLKTNGWSDIYNVMNKRTNNNVFLTVINL